MATEILKATDISLASTTLFPGFKFSPTDVELISHYLKRKIDGLDRSVEVIPEVEIHNFEPWDLPDKSLVKSESEWFFFCARGKKYPNGSQNKRATHRGYWKATGKERNVKSGTEVIGTKRTLVFHMGRAPKGERTEWIMHEYCMKGEQSVDLVVCRLKRNVEFQAPSIQRTPHESNAPPVDLAVEQNGSNSGNITEWGNMVDYYLSTESGKELINNIAELAQNLQVPINGDLDEDFYADILRDEIVKLDEDMIQGNAGIEIPAKEIDATTSRVLPLPRVIETQIKRVQEQQPPHRHEPMSRCLIGLFSFKTVNRNRWLGCVLVAVAAVLVVFYFA